ncbi:hydroxypyruvate isomerase family protein [Actinoplanes sp. ATCC 53533]|uniref:hydroxypyruvate isomerase family protein n=1 Tax=Actinoplanes sp. ATCC 53533 TaxID=1288362 RepID=UPI001F2274A8|nr:TIM barrel protein [Actinoplanes sp. ATCC 53533]
MMEDEPFSSPPGLRLDANLSTLFTELPLLRRPAAAAAAGFDAIEFWWPFDVAAPADADVDRFVTAVRDAGVRLVALNFFGGDLPGGDRGLVSWPARTAEFLDSVAVAVGIGAQLGCRSFNALYGNRIAGIDPGEQDDIAIETLAFAAHAAARIDADVLLEPLSGAARYPLRKAADAIAVIDRLPRRDNVRLLADLYHLAVNGDHLGAVVGGLTDRIGHVQIADAPGRHEPGTGSLPLARHLNDLYANGYRGFVGLEYLPTGTTLDSLRTIGETTAGGRA